MSADHCVYIELAAIGGTALKLCVIHDHTPREDYRRHTPNAGPITLKG